jgi:hypothetical protein
MFGAQKFVEKFLSQKFVSYSFYGEDVLINSILNRLKYEVGTNLKLNYVDIGAWRPIRGSNTYHFYKMGSSGTVVEPSVAFRKHWKKVRPRDNYIEAACGNMEKAKLLFFEKDSPGLSYIIGTSKHFNTTPKSTISNPILLQKKLLK